MTYKQRFKQQGIGLLELMLSLVIIAILIVMATRYFGIASKSQKINTTSSQVTELAQALYQWRNNINLNTKAPTLELLKTNGLITDELASGQTPLGPIDITSTTVAPPYAAKITTGDDKGTTCTSIKVPEGVTGSCAAGVLTLTFN